MYFCWSYGYLYILNDCLTDFEHPYLCLVQQIMSLGNEFHTLTVTVHIVKKILTSNFACSLLFYLCTVAAITQQ